MTCFSVKGFAHLYRSFLHYCNMRHGEAAILTWLLNTANLDSYRAYDPDAAVSEMPAVDFCRRIESPVVRPYHTEIQFYKSMLALYNNIDYNPITESQRDARRKLRCIIGNVSSRFSKYYGIDIDDPETVFSICAYSLIPSDWEPDCRFMDEYEEQEETL